MKDQIVRIYSYIIFIMGIKSTQAIHLGKRRFIHG